VPVSPVCSQLGKRELVPCPVPGCKKGPFEKHKGLRRHLAWHDANPSAKLYSCPACKTSYEKIEELEQHANEKHTRNAKKLWSIVEKGREYVLSLPPAEPLTASGRTATSKRRS
jgi:hypothetical protein